jgi:putative endonuclease
MFYAYILQCADGTYYVGSTNDLEKRLHSHNHLKSGAHYTKIRRPVTLVYSKKCKTYSRVRELEGEWKRLSRQEKAELIARARKKTSTKK